MCKHTYRLHCKSVALQFIFKSLAGQMLDYSLQKMFAKVTSNGAWNVCNDLVTCISPLVLEWTLYHLKDAN